MSQVAVFAVAVSLVAGVFTCAAGNQTDIGMMLSSEGLSYATFDNGSGVIYLVPFESMNHPALQVLIRRSSDERAIIVYAEVTKLPEDVPSSVYRGLVEEQTKHAWFGKYCIQDGSLFYAVETLSESLDSRTLADVVRNVAGYVDNSYPRVERLVNHNSR